MQQPGWDESVVVVFGLLAKAVVNVTEDRDTVADVELFTDADAELVIADLGVDLVVVVGGDVLFVASAVFLVVFGSGVILSVGLRPV